MISVKRIALAIALLIAPCAFAQGVITGQETLIQGSGSTLSIVPPNTPAQNFSVNTGTNTFIIPLTNPTVSLRIYITNNTANACASGFTAQMWAATDAQVSSFNNSLANWQVVPIQDSTGNLVQALLPSIPASGAVYFSTTAVSAPRVALQLVNTTAGCTTTKLEVSAVISNVAVTSPLISASSPTSFNGQTANQVQGIVAQQQNGQTVNPIIAAGLNLPLNGALLTVGIDNWNSNFKGLSTGNSGLFIINTSPTPQTTNELAISIDSDTQDNVSSSMIAPWICAPGNTCTNASDVSVAWTKNPSKGTSYGRVYQNVTSNGQDIDAIVLFSSPTATLRQALVVSNPTTLAITPLANSALIVAASCQLTHCVIPTPTDTQGNVFNLLTFQDFSNGNRTSSLWVWASSTLTTSAADTVTFGATTGTINLVVGVEVTGVNTANVTQLAVSDQSDTTGAKVVRLDAQFPEQFVCNVTVSDLLTHTCQVAPTTIGTIPVRAYVTDISLQTTTAGTATFISFRQGTGANCGTGTAALSAITYPSTTVGTFNATGWRTPLISGLQQAICATQTGTTPGTVVVELRGYFAP